MVDWNGNGKQDLSDSFIDRELYRKSAGADGEQSDWLFWLLLALGIVVLVILF